MSKQMQLALLLVLLLFFVPTTAFSSSAWVQLTPTGGPPSTRYGHSSVYDPVSNRLIVFGGCSPGPCTTTGPGVTLNDLWVLSNANGQGGTPTWIQLTPTGGAPPPRHHHVTVYDVVNNRMVIWSGDGTYQSLPNLTDVWVLTNANGLDKVTGLPATPNWSQLFPTGGPPPSGVSFPGRELATGVYDSIANRMIVFGGGACDPCTTKNDVWVLTNANGLGGTPQWLQLFPTGGPPAPREGHSAVYDAAGDRMVVFGAAAGYTNDTWVLAHASGFDRATGMSTTPAWTQLTPTGTLPPARSNNEAAYDTATNRMVIFGGTDATSFFNDVWLLDNANGAGAGVSAWSQILPTGAAPPPRYLFSRYETYDGASKRMLVFGGLGGSAGSTAFNDSWVLTEANGGGGATGVITVTTNLTAATFTVTGPGTFSGSGTSATFDNALVGTYTITFGAVGGFITPSSQTQTLTAGSTLTFTGTYNLAVGSIHVTTNTDSATFTITGPVTLSGNGKSASFTNLTPGSYTISYGPACRSDLPPSATNAVLPASTTMFIGTYAPGFLSFPLASFDPCSAHINAVFDHSQNAPYKNDFKVVAYTGETGFCNPNNPPQDFQSVVGVKHPHSGYRNQTGSAFAVNGNYTGGENGHGSPTLTCASTSAANLPSDTFLFYDGHPGYDYQASCGTPVYAAVSGTVTYPASIPGLSNAQTRKFHVLELDPDPPNSAYKLYYLHLSTYPSTRFPSCQSAPPIIPQSCNGKPCHVQAGQLIGMSGDAGVPGSPHLHFEIQVNPGIPVDPYGWKGTSGADPYKRATSMNLWP